MRIMMRMSTKNSKKIIKKLIGVVAAVIVLMAAVVAIILFHFIRKPQVKLVESMTKTVSSSQKSDLNSRYGTYNICQSMIKGNTNFSFEDTSDETDGKTVQIELLRSAADQKFFAQTSIDDKSFKLFVNKKTSLIYIDDMAVRIKYADNLITNMSNSPITTVLGLDNETVYTFGSAYENCMRLAANNYKEDNNIKTDVIEKTLKYFLDMQGDYEGSRDITVGDKSQKCKVYSVVFDVQDFYKYLDDCFGTHELDLQEVYDSLSKYMPDLETIDNAAVMVHDIKQFVDDILDGDNITFYFAINRSGELVTLYADDISDRKVSVNLSFSGTDYIAQSYELSVNILGHDGRSFVFSKKDVTDGDEIGVSYRAKIDSASVSGNIEGGLDVLFWDDNAEINLKIGNAGIKKSALISGNKKGSSLDFKWNENGEGSLHIGCDPDSIDKPEYSDSIDLFDTDIISAYKFMKKIMNNG